MSIEDFRKKIVQIVQVLVDDGSTPSVNNMNGLVVLVDLDVSLTTRAIPRERSFYVECIGENFQAQ